MDEWALFQALREELGNEAIREVCPHGRTLIILTKLASLDVQQFNGQMTAILAAVMAQDPDADRMIVDDAYGHWIVIAMEDMRAYDQGQMTFEEFRGTWRVVRL